MARHTPEGADPTRGGLLEPARLLVLWGGLATLRKVRTVFDLLASLHRLPAGPRLAGAACLAVLALQAGATWLLLSRPGALPEITWRADGQEVRLATLALGLALAGWALGGATILAGATSAGSLVFLGGGLAQLLVVAFVFLAAGKAYWVAVPTWLLALLAATGAARDRARGVRVALTVLLCGLAAWHTYLFTPLRARAGAPPWAILALGALTAAALGLRVPWRLSLARGLGLTLLAYAALAALTLRAGPLAAAQGLAVAAPFVVGQFTPLWFALGGGLARSAIASTDSTLRWVTLLVRERWLPVLLGSLWIGQLAATPWLSGRLSLAQGVLLAQHRAVAVACLALAGLLWVRGRLTAGWARGLLAAWVFAYLVLQGYFAGAFAVTAAPGTGAGALTLFVVAIAMRVVGGLREATRRDMADPAVQARLLLEVGGLTLLATGTHLGFALRDTEVIRQSLVWQFRGLTALFLPMTLAVLVARQPWLPPPPPALLARAFAAGLLGSTPVLLLRVLAFGPGGFGPAAHLGAVVTGEAVTLACVAGLLLGGPVPRRLDAVAAGVACALGLAVGYTEGVVVSLLKPLGYAALMLTHMSASVAGWFATLDRWHLETASVLPAADHYQFHVVGLFAAAAAAGAVAWGRRQGRPGLALLLALAGPSASVAWAALLYREPLFLVQGHRLPFYVLAGEPRALALLAPPVLLLIAYVYLAVWRPERREALVASTGDGGVETPTLPRGRRLVPAAAVVAASLGAAGLGAGLQLAGEPPFRAYRNGPAGVSLEHPSGWRVATGGAGEIRVFRDDPEQGPALLVQPGLSLRPGTTATGLVQLVGDLARQRYPDFRMTATSPGRRVACGREVEEIELAMTWSTPRRGPLRGRSRLTLAVVDGRPRLAYVTVQTPVADGSRFEPLLERMASSVRLGPASAAGCPPGP